MKTFALSCMFIVLGQNWFCNGQVTESFEGSIPANWSLFQTESDDPGFQLTFQVRYDKSYSIYHNSVDIGQESTSYLVTDGYLITDGVNDFLRFWYQQNWTAGYYNYSGLWISTGSNDPITNSGDFVELQEFDAAFGYSEDVWTQAVIDLSSYEGQTVYLAFKYTADYEHELYIDYFLLDSSCPSPFSLNATDLTNTSANLAWIEKNTATAWDVHVVVSGSPSPAPTTTPTDPGVANSYTKTGLTGNTAYDFYVRANCGGGDVGSWAGPFAFTTCNPNGIGDFSENFDDSSNLPGCWNMIKSPDTEIYFLPYGISSSNCAELRNIIGHDKEIFLITPYLADLSAGTHKLQFYAKGLMVNQETLEVGTISDPTDPSTFTSVETIPHTTNYQEHVVQFNNPTSDMFVAFKATFEMNSFIQIDNIVWESILKSAEADPLPGFRIYPNPVFGGSFFIASPGLSSSEVEVSLYDLLGKKVQNIQGKAGIDNHIEISTKGLQTGVYIMELLYEGKKHARKLIIE